MVEARVPRRGEIVWLDFNPQARHEQAGHEQAGHEQAGRRPAVVVSPESYNGKVGLALFCPLTRQRKGYPFEVPVPDGLAVEGVILADQVKCLDWRARRAEPIASLPPEVIAEMLGKIATLVG